MMYAGAPPKAGGTHVALTRISPDVMSKPDWLGWSSVGTYLSRYLHATCSTAAALPIPLLVHRETPIPI